jgi:hypothetical protein
MTLRGSEPREVWAITTAGSDTLSRPEFVVAADGTLCVWDWKNKSSYIFDNKGKFKKTFGKRGEGPGEILIFLFFHPKICTFARTGPVFGSMELGGKIR